MRDNNIISILDVLLTETMLVTKANPDSVRIWDRYRLGPRFVRILDWSNLGPPHQYSQSSDVTALRIGEPVPVFGEQWRHCSANWGTSASIRRAVTSLPCKLGNQCQYSESSDVTALQIGEPVPVFRRAVTSLPCKFAKDFLDIKI